ncbi:hypothetical protein [Streptomyces sp. XH2]|uniref:hypothetical protein n=1 Tax=Streptomyces sp. XH2 TaxID=3412483 RepID=UPI003C7B6EDC
MHAPSHPEHDLTAYLRERPSITRLISEARWAHYQVAYALEHYPDSETVPALRRQKFLHLGALTDVLALRTQDPDLYETARDYGELLRKVDGLALNDHPRNGIDHLRSQYGLLHGHDHGADHRPLQALNEPRRRLPIYPAGPQLIHHMCDAYTWAAMGRSPYFPAVDVPAEQRRHLLTRGLILDMAAEAAPTDTASAAAAATAGHALRALDGRPALDDARARAYLLDTFRDLDDEDDEEAPHPADCAGGCAGDGEILTVLTWESQGDGIYIPVHQEPITCPGTTHVRHEPDCTTCNGHGYTYPTGYRELCLDCRVPNGDHAAQETLPVPQGG